MNKKQPNIPFRTSKYFDCPPARISDKVFVRGVEKFLIDNGYLKKDDRQMNIPGPPFLALRSMGFIQMLLDFKEKREGGK